MIDESLLYETIPLDNLWHNRCTARNRGTASRCFADGFVQISRVCLIRDAVFITESSIVIPVRHNERKNGDLEPVEGFICLLPVDTVVSS